VLPAPPLLTTAARQVATIATPHSYSTGGQDSLIPVLTTVAERTITKPLNALYTAAREPALSGPCEHRGRSMLRSHAAPFAFSFIATRRTMTRSQISVATIVDCDL